jgi:dipeptidyl aminopeptidase/acylaminoacyl peptidase
MPQGDLMKQPIAFNAPLPPQRLADRVPFHLSPDGHWFALTVQEPHFDRPAGERLRSPDGVPPDLVGSRVVLVETTTAETREPFPAENNSWAPQWSPDGRRLAAYVRHQGAACLAVWNAVSGEVQFFPQAPVQTKYGFETPQWLADGVRIAVKLRPVDPAGRVEQDSTRSVGEPAPVSVFCFDPAAPAEQDWAPVRAAGYDPWQGDLAVVDCDSGDVRRLASGWKWVAFRVAPDGHAVAVLRSVADPENPTDDCFELVVVSTADGVVLRLAPRVMQEYGYCFNWSLDSRQIAYVETGQPSRLFVVPADGTEVPRLLSGDQDLGLPGEEYYQAPRWSPDGRTIYVLSRAIWSFAADGSAGHPIVPGLTSRLLSWVQPAAATPLLRMLDGRAILVTTQADQEGLARINLETGAAELLGEGEQAFGWDHAFQTEITTDGSAAYLASHATDRPTQVWRVAGDFRTRQVLFSLRPEVQELHPERRRRIEYRTLGSQSEKRPAILWLPPDYQEGQRLPVVVDLFSSFIHDTSPEGFMGVLHRQGYAILKLDVPSRGRDGLRQMPGKVVPALHDLVDQGIADPQRIGLFGHSRGGHAALGLITQTELFCAAVVSAARVTLTSYGTCPVDYVQCEDGIHACGGTLWENRDAYIENSPLFYLDRVRTPLLVICGTAQPEEEMQARQTYGALRRLGRRVELRLYRDEGHCPSTWTGPSVRDVTERIVAWFDQYAKG